MLKLVSWRIFLLRILIILEVVARLVAGIRLSLKMPGLESPLNQLDSELDMD